MMSYAEAFSIFKSKFPNTKATEISDFGNCFCISDAVAGDMVDADYSIDKETGDIKELSFLEFTDLVRDAGESEILTYKVK